MELYEYYYNGIHVCKEEYIRLKNLEKLVLLYFKKVPEILRDYRDWPLIKYHLSSALNNQLI